MLTTEARPGFAHVDVARENQRMLSIEALAEGHEQIPKVASRKRIGAFGQHVAGRHERRVSREATEGARGGLVPLVTTIPECDETRGIEKDAVHFRAGSTRAASSASPSYRRERTS